MSPLQTQQTCDPIYHNQEWITCLRLDLWMDHLQCSNLYPLKTEGHHTVTNPDLDMWSHLPQSYHENNLSTSWFVNGLSTNGGVLHIHSRRKVTTLSPLQTQTQCHNTVTALDADMEMWSHLPMTPFPRLDLWTDCHLRYVPNLT